MTAPLLLLALVCVLFHVCAGSNSTSTPIASKPETTAQPARISTSAAPRSSWPRAHHDEHNSGHVPFDIEVSGGGRVLWHDQVDGHPHVAAQLLTSTDGRLVHWVRPDGVVQSRDIVSGAVVSEFRQNISTSTLEHTRVNALLVHESNDDLILCGTGVARFRWSPVNQTFVPMWTRQFDQSTTTCHYTPVVASNSSEVLLLALTTPTEALLSAVSLSTGQELFSWRSSEWRFNSVRPTALARSDFEQPSNSSDSVVYLLATKIVDEASQDEYGTVLRFEIDLASHSISPPNNFDLKRHDGHRAEIGASPVVCRHSLVVSEAMVETGATCNEEIQQGFFIEDLDGADHLSSSSAFRPPNFESEKELARVPQAACRRHMEHTEELVEMFFPYQIASAQIGIEQSWVQVKDSQKKDVHGDAPQHVHGQLFDMFVFDSGLVMSVLGNNAPVLAVLKQLPGSECNDPLEHHTFCLANDPFAGEWQSSATAFLAAGPEKSNIVFVYGAMNQQYFIMAVDMNAADVTCPHEVEVSNQNTNPDVQPQHSDAQDDDHHVTSPNTLIFGTLGGFAAVFFLIFVLSKCWPRKRSGHERSPDHRRRFSIGPHSDESESEFEEVHLFGSESDCDSALEDDEFGVQMTTARY